MKRPNAPLLRLVTSFFRDHLEGALGASPHTIRAYGHAVRMFLLHLAEQRRRSIESLRPSDLTAKSVLDFLDALERTRGNGAASRNLRLAALRSFFRHLLRHDPASSEEYGRVLALPSKRARLRPATYLEPDEARAMLDAPDQTTPTGARDRALLLFLYNTGARVAEALDMRRHDIEIARPAFVRLRGKGQRERLCPLWPETIAALRRYWDRQSFGEDEVVFRNARGTAMTRDGVAYVLRKYARQVAESVPTLRKKHVTPHVLRHSCAVALLQAGVDLTVIRDYLGHASVATTNRYVTTNLDLRRNALNAFWRRAGIGPQGGDRWRPNAQLLEFLRSLG